MSKVISCHSHCFLLLRSHLKIKISIVIETKYLELAVRALHDEFELDEEPKKVESELTPSAEQS